MALLMLPLATLNQSLCLRECLVDFGVEGTLWLIRFLLLTFVSFLDYLRIVGVVHLLLLLICRKVLTKSIQLAIVIDVKKSNCLFV